MILTCDEADDVLAAYAMNALTPEERAEVAEHLMDCRLHDVDLAEYGAVVGVIGSTADEIRPPARLKGQLLAAFDREARSSRSPLIEMARRGFGTRWSLRPTLAYGIAAALLVAVLGVGALTLTGRADSNRTTVLGEVSNDAGSLRVIQVKDSSIAVLDANLPPPPDGHAYQAWKIPEGRGEPISLGLLEPRGTLATRVDLSDAIAVAISIEPAGGSTQPTTAPVLTSELS